MAGAESYVVSAWVDGELRFYAGSAVGSADARIQSIRVGDHAAYLRGRDEARPGPVTVVKRTAFRDFESALVDEVLEVALRGPEQRVRGGPYSNVKLCGAQKDEHAEHEHERCCTNMPQRLQTVINNGGGPTRY